jgi:hypothetical protein
LVTALAALGSGQRFSHAFVEPFRLNAAIAAWENLIDRFLAGVPATNLPTRPSRAPLETSSQL